MIYLLGGQLGIYNPKFWACFCSFEVQLLLGCLWAWGKIQNVRSAKARSLGVHGRGGRVGALLCFWSVNVLAAGILHVHFDMFVVYSIIC